MSNVNVLNCESFRRSGIYSKSTPPAIDLQPRKIYIALTSHWHQVACIILSIDISVQGKQVVIFALMLKRLATFKVMSSIHLFVKFKFFTLISCYHPILLIDRMSRASRYPMHWMSCGNCIHTTTSTTVCCEWGWDAASEFSTFYCVALKLTRQ